jgi:hypothetical protein
MELTMMMVIILNSIFIYIIIIIIQLFIYLIAELNSQWPVTESAQSKTTTEI